MIPKWQNILYGLLLLGTTNQLLTAGQASSPPPSSKRLVKVFLTVSGKHGSPLMPSPSELSVFVGNQPARVVSVRAAKGDQLLFAILVDISGSQAMEAKSIRESAWKIFEALSNGGNRGYLVFFNNEVEMSRAPLQESKALKALNGVEFGGGTALFDAIGETCTQTLKNSLNLDTPRRAILLISDGDDNESHLTAENAEEAAEEEGVAIFSLTDGTGEPRGKRVLMELSRKTGGQAIVAYNLGEGVTPLLAAINGQLALTLLPPEAAGRNPRSLVILSSEKDIRISAPSRVPLQ